MYKGFVQGLFFELRTTSSYVRNVPIDINESADLSFYLTLCVSYSEINNSRTSAVI